MGGRSIGLSTIAMTAACLYVPAAVEDDAGASTGTESTGASTSTTLPGTTTDGTGTTTTAGSATTVDASTTGDPTEGSGTTGTGGTGESTGTHDCPTGHVTGNGQCARYIFVTKNVYPSSFEDRDTIDATCQGEAVAAALPGAYRALVNFGEVSQMWSHVAYDDFMAAFVLPGADATVVVDDPQALRVDLDGNQTLEHAIDRGAGGEQATAAGVGCETLTDGPTARVWTGMQAAIPIVVGGPTCSTWDPAADGEEGGNGLFTAVDATWLGTGNACDCGQLVGGDRPFHIYCVEVVDP